MSIPSSPRILVVDDDLLLAEDIVLLLQDFGYDVLGAVSDPNDAVEIARKLHPHLILMDIFFRGLPRGLDAARQIHDETGIPIVFVSGANDPSVQLQVMQVDPIGFIRKPVDPRYLRAVLERAAGAGALSSTAVGGH